jgi:hypothetical protein
VHQLVFCTNIITRMHAAQNIKNITILKYRKKITNIPQNIARNLSGNWQHWHNVRALKTASLFFFVFINSEFPGSPSRRKSLVKAGLHERAFHLFVLRLYRIQKFSSAFFRFIRPLQHPVLSHCQTNFMFILNVSTNSSFGEGWRRSVGPIM